MAAWEARERKGRGEGGAGQQRLKRLLLWDPTCTQQGPHAPSAATEETSTSTRSSHTLARILTASHLQVGHRGALDQADAVLVKARDGDAPVMVDNLLAQEDVANGSTLFLGGGGGEGLRVQWELQGSERKRASQA